MRTFAIALAALAFGAVAPALHADQAASPTVTVRVADTGEEAAQAQTQQEEALQKQQQALKEQQRALREQERALREKERVIRIMSSDRPRIGIIVETEADADTDSIGAVIQAVTPGGPADQAGLKADDIIVKFNGKTLAGPNPDAGPDESGPATMLLALTKQMKEGDKIPVEYRRGKENRTTTVIPKVAKEKDIKVVVEIPDMPELKHIKIPEIPDLPENFNIDFDLAGGVLDMELVALNPELGEYFGTSEGVLVVQTPAESPLKLKGGDVILKIGDRKPSTPSQALRILRSYEPKESVSLEILRKRQKQTLTATMPEEKEFDWKKYQEVWEETPRPSKAPKAPSAPKAPAAPAPAPTPPPSPAPPAGRT